MTYVIDGEGVVRDKLIAAPNKLLNEMVLPLLSGSSQRKKESVMITMIARSIQTFR